MLRLKKVITTGSSSTWTTTLNIYRYYTSASSQQQQQPIVYNGLSVPQELRSLQAADRRKYLLQCSDKQLAQDIVDMSQQLAKNTAPHHARLSSFLNVPQQEVTASPFTLRAAALAFNSGVTFNHHELRKVITPMDDYERLKRKEQAERITEKLSQQLHTGKKQQTPQVNNKKGASSNKGMSESTEQQIVQRAEQDETTCSALMKTAPKWMLGELEMPKYSAFHQEDQMATYNPSHTSKWTPHELIHRWCKFYWSDGQTKWEMYLGAKLNELIPVVHWHALDEVLRVKSPQQWMQMDSTQQLQAAEQAAAMIKGAITYFESELELLDQEIFKGLNSLTKHGINNEYHHEATTKDDAVLPWDQLNSVTDTMLYVKSHYGRMQCEPFMAVLTSLEEDTDYIASIGEYRKFIEQRLDQLLFHPVAVSDKSAVANLEHRTKVDLLLREANRQFQVYYQYGMTGDKEAASDLSKLQHLCRTFKRVITSDFMQEVRHYLNPAMIANGLPSLVPKSETLTVRQVYEGLISCVPATSTMLEYCIERGLLEIPGVKTMDGLVEQFTRSIYFYQRLPLYTRLQQFLDAQSIKVPIIFKLLIDLEEMIVVQTKKLTDHWIEELSVYVDEELTGEEMESFTILPSRSFQMIKTNHNQLSEVHRVFSEDIDAKVQEMEATINNKKILERELAKYHEGIEQLVQKSFDPKQYQHETMYLVGIFEGQMYALEMPMAWENIWNVLQKNNNGLKYADLRRAASADQSKLDEKSLIATLLDLNQYGAIGLFPKIE
ncbi:hypothetical protein SAMD00019534_095650 [Acytostelium subglobosum LB1]|uniref:hypothetical protein n=1 Tax=Acytostelium subglobosum LB1 TaxID=1410327 RepID=UPI000644D7E5|nr:hypothetical protein SAMD00019534_095650 [Acytostelium subglobosum LB1]GAM26390.1 hypothetical protein SAMD00019534_095650 [Acytostelium subglobosum LB1]|eukprot:XP_012750486.1 hypothetical protein SAMD00019534_095650 [Acytostelium subglobosum LB1]